jgi:hypothetical protein
MDTTSHRGSGLAWAELPTVITTYLPAHQARDTKAAIEAFAADAEVTDEGRTHRGRDQIEGWLNRSAGEYTYTTTFTGASRDAEDRWDVVQRLVGDFPGGTADLHYRFTLAGDIITRLVIEP